MSNNRDKAIHYCKNIAKRIREYTQPLKHLDIKNFGYLKVTNNGKYLVTSNDTEFAFEYIEKVRSVSIERGPLKATNINKKELQFINFYNERNTTSTLLLAEHNCWNSISLVKPQSDFTEVWWFGGDKEHIIPEIYTHNHDLFKKFICYFNTQAIDIINADYTNYRNFDKLENAHHKTKEISSKYSEQIQNFLQEIDINQIKIQTPQDICKISIKEAECLRLLAHAHSIKEIAALLKISPRTVEVHLYNLRCKTPFKSKRELVNLYRTYISEYFDF